MTDIDISDQAVERAIHVLDGRIGRGICADFAVRGEDCLLGRCLCMGDVDDSIDVLLAERSRLLAQIAELEKDARRYRWMRQTPGAEPAIIVGRSYGPDMDSAIDAAMEQP